MAAAAAGDGPIDPATESGTLALRGRVVTMDSNGTVFDDAVVYVSNGTIAAVVRPADGTPAGFEHVSVTETGGTIYPGLIELHNHLSYDVLRLWQVPKTYQNRNTWAGTADYRRLISGPMGVIGKRPSLVAALVRYVEAKCLLAGVTTSQGIALYSDSGIRHFYRGIVRNVEQTDDPALPAAQARIPDVAASNRTAFWQEVGKANRLLLHLSEGTNPAARQHFTDLNIAAVDDATTSKLAGIHCVALEDDDISLFASKGCAMVWSPFSNLLLYGQTARIAELKQAGVRIGLGSDWSPSGSKNLLGELKIARLYSQNSVGGPIFSKNELVALATRNAAAILGWQTQLGSIEAGKRADLVVINRSDGDPYTTLLDANEKAVALVLVEGVPRTGSSELMTPFAADGEPITVGEPHLLNLKQATADPDVSKLTLAQAGRLLADALSHLPELAAEPAPVAALAPGAAGEHPTWTLALDETEPTGCEQRLTLPNEQPPAAVDAATPLVLRPLQLDPLTAVDDPALFETIGQERNLPAYLAPALTALYH